MREIKFRAWDRLENKMRNDIVGLVCVKGIVSGVKFSDDVLDFTGIKYLNLMQYTGLKDKNGKEIYEGDILNSYYIWEKPVIVYWDNSLCSFELKTSDEEQFEHLLDLSGENDAGENVWEVIGNIYENPELMEDK